MAWSKEAREKALKTKREKGITNQFTKAKADGKKVSCSDETKKKISDSLKGRGFSDERKKNISDACLKSNHRRLVRSIRPYTMKDGSVVMLDSSWEQLLAERLDQLNVDWVRPGPMKWIDSTGKQRNYFPDFYLPKFDLYLDPKNPIAAKQQNEKVEWLRINIKNLVFLHNEEDIKNYCPGSSVD